MPAGAAEAVLYTGRQVGDGSAHLSFLFPALSVLPACFICREKKQTDAELWRGRRETDVWHPFISWLFGGAVCHFYGIVCCGVLVCGMPRCRESGKGQGSTSCTVACFWNRSGIITSLIFCKYYVILYLQSGGYF